MGQARGIAPLGCLVGCAGGSVSCHHWSWRGLELGGGCDLDRIARCRGRSSQQVHLHSRCVELVGDPAEQAITSYRMCGSPPFNDLPKWA